MPRLTNLHYIKLHTYLRHHWLHHRMLFSYLTPNEQWDLYDYFKPHLDMADVALLEHRQEASAKFPSLAQRAGKALKHFEATVKQAANANPIDHAATKRASRQAGPPQPAHIRALVNPEIDVRRIARALVAWAKERPAPKAKQ